MTKNMTTKNIGMALLTGVLLLGGVAPRSAFAQEAPAPATLEAAPNDLFLLVWRANLAGADDSDAVEARAAIRVLDDQRRAPIDRAAELGVRARTDRNLRVLGYVGTYVFADEFRLDPETNAVEAIGDVEVTTWGQGTKVSFRTDRLTIGE
jgi:hypothetical protein